MKCKLLLLLCIVVFIVSISTVSADENITSGEVKNISKLSASNVVGYDSFDTNITVKLYSNNKSLASKEITIDLNGKTYKKVTDKKGEAKLSINLKTGKYKILFTFKGDNQTSKSSLTKTVTVKQSQKTFLSVGDKNINYRQGSKCLFYVVLKNEKGKVIKNQIVTIKVNGKTYNVKTDGNGEAIIFLNLKKGKYNIKYSFKKNAPYLSSSGSFKILVREKMAKGNGYWLWAQNMAKVNLKSLALKGTKQILLNAYSIQSHGKSKVISFIKKAHKYGIKVHLWMQVCFSNGKWISPMNSDNTIKYSFLNKKIREAKSYAKIKGVDGIHFDYLRYPGSGIHYKNPDNAINYFVKKVSIGIRKVNPNCIVSAALMPEPSSMIKYYGQNIPVMSRYVDALIPMVYKENYHRTSAWVKSVVKTFVSQSNGAQLWCGLQSYKIDGGVKKLSQNTLIKDSKAAISGGAKGIILFRFGISYNFKFI